jgi:heat shock protein HslJ
MISGTAAVNSYSGIYSAKPNGDFSVGELTITEMAGSEDEMRAEGIYLSLLQQASKYTLNETTLTLLDGNMNELLIFGEL